jgi:hypothetical protein
MNMQDLLLALTVIILVFCTVCVFLMFRRADYGYEDCTGFHAGQPPEGHVICANCDYEALCEK